MQSPAIEAMFARFGPRYRYYVSFTAMLGTVAMVLSATMINVAVPVIMGAFGVGQDKVHWLSTGFIAAMTVSMLANDWCVRAFGMRATYIGAMVVFAVGAIMGGLSPSIDIMIVSRLFQGAGAGIVQPLAMIIMFQVFPVEQRGRAMGLFGLGVVVAPTVGPALGGVLLDGFNWHYVFYMAVPVALVGIFLSLIFIPGKERAGPMPRFDVLGLILIALCIFSFLTGLSNGQREGWQAPIISVYFSVAAVSGVAFIFWELMTKNPIMDIRVFYNRKFVVAALVGMVLGAGLFGSIYIIPLFVQTIQGYTPTRSGMLMVPGGIIMMISFPIAGRLSDKLPHYQMILFGMFVYGFSCILMMEAHTDTPFWVFAGWIMLGRIGLASVMPTLTVVAVSTLRPDQMSQGSGAINFTRQLGGAIGINLISLGLDQRTAMFSDAFLNLRTPDNETMNQMMVQLGQMLGQLGWPLEKTPAGALYLIGQGLYSQASMMAFRDVFMLIGVVYFAMMIPVLLLYDRRRSKLRRPQLRAQPQSPPQSPLPALPRSQTRPRARSG
ncbi:MAG: DHA2 family efflux MFS transporter permease subunit [Alphaproteobacteria bacterium]|nr:DHA2 family efflux MFS transporter permease subunit [Alphaproteobacteria bacterium]